MTRNCRHCGRFFSVSDPRNRSNYCGDDCRLAAHRERERVRMREYRSARKRKILTGPLLRLSDVPATQRLAAFRHLVDSGELTPDEIPLAFAAALEPGDLSARAA